MVSQIIRTFVWEGHIHLRHGYKNIGWIQMVLFHAHLPIRHRIQGAQKQMHVRNYDYDCSYG